MQVPYEQIPFHEKTNIRFYTSEDSGSYVAPHWHDAVEMICIQEGELQVTAEQETVEVRGGQCIVINADQIHSTLCTGHNRAIVCQIPQALMEKFLPDAKSLMFCLRDPSDTKERQEQADQIKEVLADMQYFMESPADGALLKFNSLLYELIFLLYQNFGIRVEPSEVTKREKNLEKLKPVLAYIKEHYNERISLKKIAGIAAFEPKYFCRFFKKHMGVTFLEYQNELRLSRIYEDIIHTDGKISDILEKHGFTNYKLFRRMFDTRFHMTPTQLRN